MVTGQNWSELEIISTVADYMTMLTLELAGQSYNKTSHRNTLLQKLDGRSSGAVELKHQNISAVLRDLGCTWISGYKPRGNYQSALAKFVEHWINSHQEFDDVSLAAAEQPAFVPTDLDFSKIEVDPPSRSREISEPSTIYAVNTAGSKRDYIAREARNVALGNAGELLIMQYEEFRLRQLGKRNLADRIEHVSTTKGDGLGYDILSFDESGKERFIEVKTTSFAKETPFYASRNEIKFSKHAADQFHLYRLYDFRRLPRLFALQGEISKHCSLDPISYVCRF